MLSFWTEMWPSPQYPRNTWLSRNPWATYICPWTNLPVGVRWKVKDKEYAIRSCREGIVVAWDGKRLCSMKSGEGRILPTNYQFFNVLGVSSPVSSRDYPSGMGNTLIFDSHRCKVRPLSMMECWKLQGVHLLIAHTIPHIMRKKVASFPVPIGPSSYFW